MSAASLLLHLATVAAVAVFIIWLWSRIGARAGLIAALSIAGWLAISAGLSISGFTSRVDILPPGAASIFVPTTLALVAILFAMSRKRFATALATMPLAAIILAQTFRFPVEVVLAWLVGEGKLPSLLSYHGTNFDILTGLTAPLAAWAATRGYDRIVLLWNLLGLALVLNVVGSGVLAGPGPLQFIKVEPTSIFTMSFPLVWLPGFLVPVAILLHGLAILKLRAPR
jgi:hypothetical protein